MPDTHQFATADHAVARERQAKRRLTVGFLIFSGVVCLYLCYYIARPFLEPILFAGVLAVVFNPLYARLEHRLRRANLAALLSTIIVFVIVVLPVIGLASAIAREVSGAYGLLHVKSAANGGWMSYVDGVLQKPLALAARHFHVSNVDLKSSLRQRLEEYSSSMLAYVGGALRNLEKVVFNLALSFFTLFFLLREGRKIRVITAASLPLEKRHISRLFNSIHETIVANFYGVLAVSAIQGVFVGLALVVLGVPSPILGALLTSFCSMVPVIGSALVWVPAALYLWLAGHWIKALVLVGCCSGIAVLVDHIVRPYIIGGRVRMNTLLVFFALLGGIEAFGLLGIFLGPLILSITAAVLGMLRDENRAWEERLAREESSSEWPARP